MTGCDLRYKAEQMGMRATGRFQATTDAVMDAYYSLDEVGREVATVAQTLESTYLTRVGGRITALLGTLSQIMEDNRARSRDTMTDVNDTIEEVRTHFHEAVEERASSEGCGCDEERREAYGEGEDEGTARGRREMFRELRDAVQSALEGCEE